MKICNIKTRYLTIMITVFAVGCQFGQQTDTAEDLTAACARAAEIEEECSYIDIDCGEPLVVTCSYKEVSRSSSSCSCDNRIYREICDAGITDSLEELEAGISCTTENNN